MNLLIWLVGYLYQKNMGDSLQGSKRIDERLLDVYTVVEVVVYREWCMKSFSFSPFFFSYYDDDYDDEEEEAKTSTTIIASGILTAREDAIVIIVTATTCSTVGFLSLDYKMPLLRAIPIAQK